MRDLPTVQAWTTYHNQYSAYMVGKSVGNTGIAEGMPCEGGWLPPPMAPDNFPVYIRYPYNQIFPKIRVPF